MSKTVFAALAMVLAFPFASSAALAGAVQTTTVSAKTDVYKGFADDGSDGLAPTAIDVSGLTSITFDALASAVTVNGSNYNDADGLGSVSGEFNTGTTIQSGITAPTAGYLAGVFYGATAQASAPSALNFDGVGGTDFTSLAPELQQTFFIGDGRVGTGGATQTFYVPAGATTLYLGLTDACGYSGGPSCYGDNSGSISVAIDGVGAVSGAPEPGTWALMFAGLAVLGAGLRAARRQRPFAQFA